VFPTENTQDPGAVRRFLQRKHHELFPKQKMTLVLRVFDDVVSFFEGKHPDYAASDLKYHDLEHTLQASVCLVLILEGRVMARAAPRLSARQFELALTAALLHDAGYLKLRSDMRGTGAKYTFCHVLRGCAFAASYLPLLGVSGEEVQTVMAAINCTGPGTEISRLHFRRPLDRIVGCAVTTADYLGQMAALDYPDELEILYTEFQESDDFLNIPRERRLFKSAGDLAARTPNFWRRFVKLKIEGDFSEQYKFLERPCPGGSNEYIAAIERNIQKIENRAAAAAAQQTSSAGSQAVSIP
jgi:hypothetical protein